MDRPDGPGQLSFQNRKASTSAIRSAEFVVGGQWFLGYNGGSYFSSSEGGSLCVDCADQNEVDEYWDKLVKAGAHPPACGWIKDPFGLSWQIVPGRFTELIGDGDPRKAKAVLDAMMTMVKLDLAGLEKACNEAEWCSSTQVPDMSRIAAWQARPLHE